MDILFLFLLTVIFIVQIVMLVYGIKNKKSLLGKLLLLEIVSVFIAAFVVYYFNEVLFKYAPGFEGFLQIGCAGIFIPLYLIMFVITAIILAIKTAKINKNCNREENKWHL